MWVLDAIPTLRRHGFATADKLETILVRLMRAHPTEQTYSWEWADCYTALFRNRKAPQDLHAIARKEWGFCPQCGGLLSDPHEEQSCDWILDDRGSRRRYCSEPCMTDAMKREIVSMYNQRVWDRLEADLHLYQLKHWADVSWLLDRMEEAQ